MFDRDKDGKVSAAEYAPAPLSTVHMEGGEGALRVARHDKRVKERASLFALADQVRTRALAACSRRLPLLRVTGCTGCALPLLSPRRLSSERRRPAGCGRDVSLPHSARC
jgi:hypothetical protein